MEKSKKERGVGRISGLGTALLLMATLLLTGGCGEQKPLMLSGIVEVQSVRLAFEEEGVLASVPVDVNDAIAKGELVATQEQRELSLERETVRFELNRAQAELENLLHTPRPEAYDAAVAREKAAKAEYENAKSEYERSTALYERKVETEQQYRRRQTELATAKERYEAVRAEAALVAAGSKKEALEMQRMQIKVFERRIEKLDVRLEKRKLISPLNGVVLTRNFEPGEYVRRGQSVVSIADLEDCWVRIYLPEEALADVGAGDTVEVRFDSKRTPVLEGCVSEISQEASFAPRMNLRKEQRGDLYFPVKIAVENREHRLKPGMVADVLFRR